MNLLGGILGGGGASGIGGLTSMLGGGGGGLLGQLIGKVMSTVMQGAIEDVAKAFNISDSVKNTAQADAAKAFGDKDGEIKNLREAMADYKKESKASDTDMGHIDRKGNEVQELFKKLVKEMLNEENDRTVNNAGKKKGGGSAAGAGAAGGAAGGAGEAGGAGAAEGAKGAEAAGGTDSAGAAKGTESTGGKEIGSDTEGEDWFTKIAFALAKGAQKQADKVAEASDKLTNANKAAESAAGGDDEKATKAADNKQMEAQTKLQAESSKMGFLMQAVNASINSLGEALKTAAQVK